MRFLLLNQFYPPDVAPTGRYLHDLARAFVRRGHKVKVFCSRSSYDGTGHYDRHEILDGVEITRLTATGFGRSGFLGKIADYASFYVSLLAALMIERHRPDVILALTTPPYIGLLAKLAAMRHRSRHAHWIMDLYPDVMLAHGMKRGRFTTKPLQMLTRFQFKGAARVLSLGPAMARRVEAYLPSTQIYPSAERRAEGKSGSASPARTTGRSGWFPLWSDPGLAPWPDDEANPLRIERKWGLDETIFLYSGNMGLGHRFGEFLEAAGRLGTSGPRWVFAGGGKRMVEVEAMSRAVPGGRVEFMGYVPNNLLRAHLCAADVHLVSLD
ncbi:MAG: glycosyltransferase family 4 protein, partial [Limisphaerales bacterium]